MVTVISCGLMRSIFLDNILKFFRIDEVSNFGFKYLKIKNIVKYLTMELGDQFNRSDRFFDYC